VSRADDLTTTSYAVLGLLALRDWSTYELAQQMQRSMRLWWPRAASRVYEEPKRLVRLGLATRTRERTGRRPRTVYGITDDGRAALRAWLREPSGSFRLEFEGMLKVFFGDQVDKPSVLASIAAIRDAARAERDDGRPIYDDFATTGGPFPDRLHIIALVTDFYERFIDALLDWADHAEAEVASWRSTTAAPDRRAVFEERAQRGVGG